MRGSTARTLHSLSYFPYTSSWLDGFPIVWNSFMLKSLRLWITSELPCIEWVPNFTHPQLRFKAYISQVNLSSGLLHQREKLRWILIRCFAHTKTSEISEFGSRLYTVSFRDQMMLKGSWVDYWTPVLKNPIINRLFILRSSIIWTFHLYTR